MAEAPQNRRTQSAIILTDNMPDYQTQSFERDYPTGILPRDWREVAAYCWICDTLCQDETSLRNHQLTAHPQAVQPAIILRRELSRLEVLRAPFDAEELLLLNCTGVDLGRGLLTQEQGLAELKRIFRKPPAGALEFKLVNKDVQVLGEAVVSFKIDFRLDNPEDLEFIETSFLVCHHKPEVLLQTLDHVVNRVQTAREYGSQLYAFILAMQARSTSSNEIDWAEKLRGVLGLLRQYDRPIAKQVSMAARWCLNYFPGPVHSTGCTSFDHAFGVMRDLCGQVVSDPSVTSPYEVPSMLDWLDALNRDMVGLCAERDWPPSYLSELEQRCRWKQDRLKISALKVKHSDQPEIDDLKMLDEGGPFAFGLHSQSGTISGTETQP